MKKIKYLIPTLTAVACIAPAITSCNNDDEIEYVEFSDMKVSSEGTWFIAQTNFKSHTLYDIGKTWNGKETTIFETMYLTSKASIEARHNFSLESIKFDDYDDTDNWIVDPETNQYTRNDTQPQYKDGYYSISIRIRVEEASDCFTIEKQNKE